MAHRGTFCRSVRGNISERFVDVRVAQLSLLVSDELRLDGDLLAEGGGLPCFLAGAKAGA